MKIKTLLLCTTITLSLGAVSAHAESTTSGPRYVPRDEISQKNYTQTHRMQDYSDIKSYQAYEGKDGEKRKERARRIPATINEDVSGGHPREKTKRFSTFAAKNVDARPSILSLLST